MRVRMIFASRGEAGGDWFVGEIREASAEFARQLIKEGRAEPVEAEVVEHRDPKPAARKHK